MAEASQRRVVVVDYDPEWPQTYERLSHPIASALRGIALSIEHVGSTSVPGLAAKPIIDIDVIIRSRAELPLVIGKLAALGYRHLGDLGVEDREAFGEPSGMPAHHLYVCIEGSAAVRNHLAIRESLRRNPEAVAEYGRLKQQLASQFPTDIGSYVDGKTALLVDILRGAGFEDAELQAIRAVNRKK